MLPEIDSNLPIFHGSRCLFEKLDSEFVLTGEGVGVGIGFYFVNSLKGAANHAKGYAKQSGEPIVYVAKLKPSIKILTKGEPISSHRPEIYKKWHLELPFSCHSIVNCRDWFSRLANEHFTLRHHIDRTNKIVEKATCQILLDKGFDAIDNFEWTITDGYLHGTTILILNYDMIEIIESHLVKEIYPEILGDAKKYVISDKKRILGDTNRLSYLMRI